MGWNDIIKPLSTVLRRAVIESLVHRIIQILSEKFPERGESNPGALGLKRERYPLCYAPPYSSLFSVVPKVSHQPSMLILACYWRRQHNSKVCFIASSVAWLQAIFRFACSQFLSYHFAPWRNWKKLANLFYRPNQLYVILSGSQP